MKSIVNSTFWLIVCLVIIFPVIAQEETEEDTVSYVQHPYFNVPKLYNWEEKSTDTLAQFVYLDFPAQIQTIAVETDKVDVGIKRAVLEATDIEVDTATYEGRVNLADGTWNLRVFQPDEVTTISAMGQVRDNLTYVISFIESSPDSNMQMLILRNEEDGEEDPTPAMREILSQFTQLDAESEPEDTTVHDLPSGEWAQFTFNVDDTPISILGMVFGNHTYLTFAQGDIEQAPEMSNAFNTTVLGFFVTSDNTEFLYLALAVSFGLLILFGLSLWYRANNLRKDVQVIQQLAED